MERRTPGEATETLYLRAKELSVEYGKFGVGRGWLFNLPFVGIMSPEEAEILLSSTTNITKSSIIYNLMTPWLGTGLLTSTGNKWHQRRKMLTPAFHFNILKKFLIVFSKESKHLVEVLKKLSKEKEELDIIPIISKFTLDTISETAMGTPLGSLEGPKYYQSIYDIGEICIGRIMKPWFFLQSLYFFTPTYRRQCKIIKYLHEFSMDIINRRKKIFSETPEANDHRDYSERKKAAMLDILLLAQKEIGDIDDEGIREEVDTFMFEGHDTTSLALVHVLMLLANHRTHQDKIYNEIMNVLGENHDEPTYSNLQELKYMEMCIKETLRLYPSVPIIARQLDADMETLTGKIIPANCTCLIAIFHIHKDPSIYPNPDVFDPDRFLPENVSRRHPFSYIPFSAGPRNCIGQKFAMIELKCAITEVLRNFILEPVDTPETIEYYFDLLLRPAGPIKVKFVPRNS